MTTTHSDQYRLASSPVDMDQLRGDVRKLRKERGLTQADLAQKLGVTQAAVSAFEKGKNAKMRKQTLNRLIDLVGDWKAASHIVRVDFAGTSIGASNEQPAVTGQARANSSSSIEGDLRAARHID